MCLSCGCGEPENDHGNPDNITIADLEAAQKAGDVSDLDEVVNNIENTFADTHPDFEDDDDRDEGAQPEK